MKTTHVIITALLAPVLSLHAAAPDLTKLNSRADLDAVIAATTDPALKQTFTAHAAEILLAAEQHRHVEAVIRTIESAPGTFTKINTTPEALKTAAGGELALFDTLTQVSTNILAGKAHDHRNEKDDPYNAAFIEHLGHIPSLESLKLEASGIQDEWLAPLLKLKKLKSLSVNGFGKLGDASLSRFKQLTECPDLTNLELAYFAKATDAGWENLAGLRNLESFTPRGAGYPGHCFAKFEGWTKLKRINFHSNGLDDEGLGYVCEKFPKLEFIKLWHSKNLTDSAAEHFKKLKHLTGIEISCAKATAGLVKHLRDLPLEYIALESGMSTPAADAIAIAKATPTLRKLSLDAKAFTDTDLNSVAGVTQIRELSLSGLELPDDRLPQLQAFAHLNALTLVRYGKGYSDETQAKIKALLPKAEVKFVK
jgi:hypothetical protein